MDLHLSQACRQYATQSSTSFFDRQLSDAHIANEESVKNSGVNKSAKVVLVVESMCEFANQKVLVRDPRPAGNERVSDFILCSDRLHCLTLKNLRCSDLLESRCDHVPILVP
jgi:hypothetical protein